jgi:uncharacterized membrane protein
MKKDQIVRRFIAGLSILGILDSLYLLYIKISNEGQVCTGGCEAVNSSIYSEIFDIPIAIFGALGYLFILLVILLNNKYTFIKEYSVIAIFGFSFIGVLYSAYLTYLEVYVIDAICEYCVISAVVMTFIFILSIFRFNTAE